MCENTSWQAPIWLTDTYLEDVLKYHLNDKQVRLINIAIKPATANGENYASVMSRITVQFIQESLNEKPQELKFIMKYSYESDPYISKIMSDYHVFNTEMQMYETILPQLANILQEVGYTKKLFATTLKVDYKKSAIIFEDLNTKKYVLTDRLAGLNETHARMALKKLAIFHAASAVLNRRLKGELEKFQHGILNRHTQAFACVFEYLIEACANFAQRCPELGSYYYEKLTKLKPFIVEYGIRACNSNPKHFHTLCHGDLWINNMMMLYDHLSPPSQTLKDVLLIDFQFCNWASVAVDLHYFLYTSLQSELQLDKNSLNKFVQYYHNVLTNLLKKFKYEGYIPTLHGLHVQLVEGGILALAAATVSQPIMINDQCDDADFHSLIDDDERGRKFRNKLYENQRLQKNLKILLPYFDQIGLLDVQN